MRRLLLFPGHRILAYEWHRGTCRRVEAFEPDDNGRAAFRGWLDEAPRTPVQLLVDIIEEEFHSDQVPHVIGRDRRDLYARAAQKHFGNKEFRHIAYQGRRADGRRDDRILLAGLTNPDGLSTWLGVIQQAEVALKGIYSLPLLGQALLPHLGAARAERVLVVSQQVPSTLRQSYYENGRLRFSRLVPGRYQDPAEYAEFVRDELDRTLHFLEGQRFHRRDEPIATYLLTSADSLDGLGGRLTSDAGMTCHRVPIERLARRIGLRDPGNIAFADTLFTGLLMRQRRPTNHYGHARLRRFLFVQRARLGLRWAAAAAVVAAVAVAGTAWLRGAVYDRAIDRAEAREARFQRLYQQRFSQLAEFDHRAIDVKNAVDLLADAATAARETPERAMNAIGRIVGDHPAIAVESLAWQRAQQDSAAASNGRGPGLGGTPGARLTGRVVGGDADYRRAINRFEAFVEALRANAATAAVSVAKAPFDLEPSTAVSGGSGTTAADGRDERADFAVELRLPRRDADNDHG
jgi:hypothetical protein